MKVLVLYRPKSDHRRMTEEFIETFRSRSPQADIVVMDIDSREGDSMARLYDVVSYPAILVVKSDDGALQKLWQGTDLPLIDEVQSYSRV